MTKPAFDPARPLTMNRHKTVLGHGLPGRTRLTVVEDPSAPGEVDKDTAARLWRAGIASYEDERRPTPVESKESEAARLLAGEPATPTIPASEAGGDQVEIAPDLITWQQDDMELGRKAGDDVTSDDLRMIAGREEIDLTGAGRSKADLQLRIMEVRALRAAELTA